MSDRTIDKRQELTREDLLRKEALFEAGRHNDSPENVIKRATTYYQFLSGAKISNNNV